MSVTADTGTASLFWLARHELRLAFRDWRAMITAGNKRRLSTALVILAIVGLALHLPAWAIVARFGEDGIDPDVGALTTVSLVVLLYLSLLLSQAMESVTRSLYARGDLELVLSSPVAPTRLFAVRIVTNASLIALVALVLTSPFLDVLMLSGGPRWLTGYAVAVAFGLACGAIAVAITLGLFRLLGPRRTRLVAQVVAAVIGAAFAIGIQVSAILYYGSFGQSFFTAAGDISLSAPDVGSLIWLPARAILGDWSATAGVVALALVIVVTVVVLFAPRLGENSLAATDLAVARVRKPPRQRPFRSGSSAWAMRRKEWALLRRDPWLASQTLTQLLYLLPPALLLSQNFGAKTGAYTVVVMVLVTVGGQLAGALAWLAISGEDAPDLVATAPLRAGAVTRAKVEAVIGAIAMVLGPLIAIVAYLSPRHGLAALIGVLLAAASTVRIQMWFRAQAKRNHFRRRHTSSRIATFAEALVSFSWAAAAGLAASGTWLAGISVVIAALILIGARSVSPRKALAA